MPKPKPYKYETIINQEEKGRDLQENVQSFQEIKRLKEEIGINVQHIIEANFPPIIARLDQIQKMLVAIGAKVDISDFEMDILNRLMDEVTKKK